MKNSIKYFGAAATLTILFFINAATPVQALGCYTRGLVAAIIGLICGLTAIASMIISLKKRMDKDPTDKQWMLLTLVLAIPLVALIILA
jgi:cytochrome bd-type quinol oxidase subunit 1